jgi:hypothetical protein
MSRSTQVVIKDFATPVRGPPASAQASSELAEEKKDSLQEGNRTSSSTKETPVTVTPPESGARDASSREGKNTIENEDGGGRQSPLAISLNEVVVDSPAEQDNKHVRFDGTNGNEKPSSPADSPASSNCSNNQRGVVSRRGGRFSSPGRAAGNSSSSAAKETVLEFKTYRSPPRKRDENDTIPSLCSPPINKENKNRLASTSAKSEAKIKAEEDDDDAKASSEMSEGDRKPKSISCDSSNIATTSPLASHDADPSNDTSKARQLKEPPGRLDMASARKNNVSFSPPPPVRESAERVSVVVVSFFSVNSFLFVFVF